MKSVKLKKVVCILLTGLLLSACAAKAPAADSSQTGSETAAQTDGETTASAEDASSESAAASAGIMSSFQTTDLDGNAVSADIFADYELTFVNVWGTFCGPCISEMPDLGELAAEYEEKGVQVIGLVSDVLKADGTVDDAMVEEAKAIVEQTGADYLHIVPSEDLFGLLSQISAVPTSFLVDSEGKQVGSAVPGAQDKEGWMAYIDEALAQ